MRPGGPGSGDRGGRVPNYALAGFAHDAHTFTATWTLAQPIGLDRLLLELPADAGLDFGAGVPWAGLSLPFNVVPGDVDRNGRVDAFDTLGARAKQGSNLTTNAANYSPWFDVDGNGRIDAFDTLGIRARQGTNLNQVPTSATFSDAGVGVGEESVLAKDDELARWLA